MAISIPLRICPEMKDECYHFIEISATGCKIFDNFLREYIAALAFFGEHSHNIVHSQDSTYDRALANSMHCFANVCWNKRAN